MSTAHDELGDSLLPNRHSELIHRLRSPEHDRDDAESEPRRCI